MQTHLFFRAYFLEYLLLFLDDSMEEECESFSKSNSSTLGRGLALLNFLPISAWHC